MREILFRGKRLDNGEWITGHLLKYEDGSARIVPNNTDIFCFEKDESIIQTIAHRVDPKNVGQYTGFVDKNGKKIFEGDIVIIKDDLNKMYYLKWFDDMCFAFADIRSDYKETFYSCYDIHKYGFPLSEQVKIIGNIYDNPELLKDDK